jgi:hypothetical protein
VAAVSGPLCPFSVLPGTEARFRRTVHVAHDNALSR